MRHSHCQWAGPMVRRRLFVGHCLCKRLCLGDVTLHLGSKQAVFWRLLHKCFFFFYYWWWGHFMLWNLQDVLTILRPLLCQRSRKFGLCHDPFIKLTWKKLNLQNYFLLFWHIHCFVKVLNNNLSGSRKKHFSFVKLQNARLLFIIYMYFDFDMTFCFFVFQ